MNNCRSYLDCASSRFPVCDTLSASWKGEKTKEKTNLKLPGYATLFHCSAASGSYTRGISVVLNFGFHGSPPVFFMGYLTLFMGDSIFGQDVYIVFSEAQSSFK